MSVVSVEPIASRASTINAEFARTYLITYRVVTDDPFEAGYVARTAVPYVIGSPYVFGSEFDTGAFCVDINADEEDVGDGQQWLVKCQFGPRPQLEENPFLQPWELDLDGQNIEVPYQIDSDGRPVINTVGDVFSTALMKQMNQPILTITRNEAIFNPQLSLFANTINGDVFYGSPPGTVFCNTPKQKRLWSATWGYYFPTTYRFIGDPNGWDHSVINQGFRARNVRGVLKNIIVQGVPITEPALLDYSGNVLPQNVPPVVLTFKPYPRMPFAALGL
jgi:hypothetical protein